MISPRRYRERSNHLSRTTQPGNWTTGLAVTLLLIFPGGPTAALANDGDVEPRQTPSQDAPEPPFRHPFEVNDVAGKRIVIGEARGSRGSCLVFLHPECPISNQYVQELNRIAERFGERIEFFGVLSDPKITREEAKRYVKDFSIAFPVLFDASSDLAIRLRPTHVPEAFVFDDGGSPRYRGRINDQFAALGKRRPQVTSHDLVEALAAVVAGEPVPQAKSEIVGCVFEAIPKNGLPEKVTYARDIAPIVQNQCVNCHRAGEVAPFSLTSFEDVAKRARMIAEVVSSRQMPPWKLAANFGHFLDERRLTDRQIALLVRWAELESPRGDPDDLPEPRQFGDGWQLGTPDLVLRMPEAYHVPATGPDIFRFFVMPIDIPEDKVVVAAEYRPGNPRIVHHAILYVDGSGVARQRDAADPEPGYPGLVSGGFVPQGALGFWAPGYSPRFLPNGAGRMLRKNSDLALQLHFHLSGKEESEQSTIGLYFAKKPTTLHAAEFAIGTVNVDIPPGESRHRMTARLTTPVNLTLVSVTPHMHLIGKEMKVTATLPDGEVRPIVWVNDWDFNWQDQYHYVQPIELPKGTRLDLEAYYDNSEANPANPNSPPRRIEFGLESTHEMCLCGMGILTENPKEDLRALQKAFGDSLRQDLKSPAVGKLVRMLIREQLSQGPAVNTP